MLHVADTPLNVAGGFRSFPDLRVGEPIYAVVSRTSAEYAVAEGQLAAKGDANRQPAGNHPGAPAGHVERSPVGRER